MNKDDEVFFTLKQVRLGKVKIAREGRLNYYFKLRKLSAP